MTAPTQKRQIKTPEHPRGTSFTEAVQTNILTTRKPGQSLLVPIEDKPTGNQTRQASTTYTGHNAGLHPEDTPEDISEDEAMYITRPPTSTLRWNTTDDLPPQNRQLVRRQPAAIPSRQSAIIPQGQLYQRPRRRFHWLVWLGLILFIMLDGYVLFSLFGNFWQTKLDDFRYGNPRTWQTDQNVGHYGYTSHFVALNLNGKIEIIETQPQNPNAQESTHLYIAALLTADQSLQPVTLKFIDLTGTGKLDMLIFVGNDLQVPMYNNGKSFQNQSPGH